MSKWIKTEKFKKFVSDKSQEKDTTQTDGFVKTWKNPKMGTTDKAKEYKVRFVPDKNSNFYKKFSYHYFIIDEKHYFIFCPKTNGMKEYCPWCSISQMLYKGNKEDKKLASNYKRKEKFVSNIHVINDPRDVDVEDEYKASGKTMIYEFPSTIESKLKNELTDKTEGYGMAIFDPENGYDLIIKIKAKKPDTNGKVWPDYSDTIFSRNQTKLGNDEIIQKIMDETVDLDEYLQRKVLTWEEHKDLIKLEGFWEEISDEFERRTNLISETIDKPTNDDDVSTDISQTTDNNDDTSSTDTDDTSSTDTDNTSTDDDTSTELSDEELLKELQNM